MAHDSQKDVYTLTYHFQGKRRLFLMIVGLLLLVGLLTGGLPAEAARLENPGEGQVYSGIGVISGWKCEADGPLTIRFNSGPPVPLVYGSERPDTRSVCGDANNGFVALWNWGNLHTDSPRATSGSSSSLNTVHADTHTARAYDNGVMFAETTFEVGTLGVEFLRGFGGGPQIIWSGGNRGGHNIIFAWNENTQHFEVGTGRVWGPDSEGESVEQFLERDREYEERREQLEQRQLGWHTETARLENPGDGQLYSGIGVISGWKCEADGPLTVRFNDGRSIPLVYGSERTDTRSVCGDANNGFVAIWNWGNLGDGIHTARVYDNGVAFAETTFQVGTLGVEVWDGIACYAQDLCGVETFDSTLINEFSPTTQLGPYETNQLGPYGYVGYDGGIWAAPGTASDTWNTYFKWNANTQHFEAFARRRYQRGSIPEPPPAWRWQEPSFEDRPDDFSGPQIHVYHAKPRDAGAPVRDMIGYISAEVQAAQRWLATRTYQGRAFRIDTYQGRPDVTTLPLAVTTAEMQAYKPETLFDVPILPGGVSLWEFGQHDPHKLHVVFIEAPPARDDDKGWTNICGGAVESSGVALVFAGMSFGEGVPPSPDCPRLSLVFVHEVFHLLGAVHPDAPHSDGAHIYDGSDTENEGYLDEDGRPVRDSDLPLRTDLMQPRGHEEAELDIGSDDYYFHPEKTPVWPPPEYDTVDSPFFTAGPWIDRTRAAPSHALRAAPPEGQPAIAPDNQTETVPYYRVLPEPLPEGQDGHSPNGWCVVVD